MIAIPSPCESFPWAKRWLNGWCGTRLIPRSGITGEFCICNKTSQHCWAAFYLISPLAGTEERLHYMILLLSPYLFCLFSIGFVSNQSRVFAYPRILIINKSVCHTFNNSDIDASVWPCLCLKRGRKLTPKAGAQYLLVFFWGGYADSWSTYTFTILLEDYWNQSISS